MKLNITLITAIIYCFEIMFEIFTANVITMQTEHQGEYKIRSIYFDHYHDKALQEKLMGINNREKFRIRYYNDDVSFIRLEKKSKDETVMCQSECSIE